MALASAWTPAGAQEPDPDLVRLAGPEVERVRILGLEEPGGGVPLVGTRRLRPGAADVDGEPRRYLAFPPLSIRTAVNTGWARSRSDEGSWGGRGVELELRGGLAGGWGPLEFALVPSVFLEQNRSFALPARASVSEFHYPWHDDQIDWALRPGAGSGIRAIPGQAHLSLAGGPVRGGLSTQPLRWGPALRYPVILSGTAQGFPHVYVETRRPVRTPVGAFDAEVIMGRPSASLPRREFEGSLAERGFTGILLAWAPWFAPELTLGLSAVNHADFSDDFSTGDQLRELLGLFANPFALELEDNVPGNALGSFYLRWRAPARGLELYLELAREDHAGDLDDFTQEPDHSLGFTAGVQKALERGEDRVRLLAELSDLRGRIPLGVRGTPVFYRHSRVRVGHTHRGQLLGSPLGPGSLALHLGADLLSAVHGLVGVYVERTEYDADAHRERFASTHGSVGRDREWTLGLRHHRVLGSLGPLTGVELSAEGAYSRRSNRHFLGFTGAEPPPSLPVEGNWHLDLRLTWRPRPPSSGR